MGIKETVRRWLGLGDFPDQTEYNNIENMKKYLIVGLGNIGPEYVGTRHNAGFMVADCLVKEFDGTWKSCRYGDMSVVRIKNCELLVLKP